MRWFRFALLLLAATLLQATLVDAFSVKDVKPDLHLILLVLFVVYSKGRDVIIASFTIGFAADLTGAVMGPSLVSFGLVGTLLGYLSHIVVLRQMPHQAVVIFVTGILTGVIIYCLTWMKSPGIAGDIVGLVFSRSLYSGIVGPFLFLPCAWWMRIRKERLKVY